MTCAGWMCGAPRAALRCFGRFCLWHGAALCTARTTVARRRKTRRLCVAVCTRRRPLHGIAPRRAPCPLCGARSALGRKGSLTLACVHLHARSTRRERGQSHSATLRKREAWSARAARSKRPARAYMALSATWPTRTASISAVRSERAAHHTSRSPQSPPPAPGGHQIGRRHFRPSTTELDPYHPSAPQAPRSRTCGRPALFECSIT